MHHVPPTSITLFTPHYNTFFPSVRCVESASNNHERILQRTYKFDALRRKYLTHHLTLAAQSGHLQTAVKIHIKIFSPTFTSLFTSFTPSLTPAHTIQRLPIFIFLLIFSLLLLLLLYARSSSSSFSSFLCVFSRWR